MDPEIYDDNTVNQYQQRQEAAPPGQLSFHPQSAVSSTDMAFYHHHHHPSPILPPPLSSSSSSVAAVASSAHCPGDDYEEIREQVRCPFVSLSPFDPLPRDTSLRKTKTNKERYKPTT
jgi:hypothetical protein